MQPDCGCCCGVRVLARFKVRVRFQAHEFSFESEHGVPSQPPVAAQACVQAPCRSVSCEVRLVCTKLADPFC